MGGKKVKRDHIVCETERERERGRERESERERERERMLRFLQSYV
jgi:hypothetical protein